MTNIDTSPEAVEQLKNRLAEFWAYDTGHLFGAADDMIDALSAALTESRAETAAAYERAVEVEDARIDASRLRSCTIPRPHKPQFQTSIYRAVGTPDKAFARDRMITDAEARGMRRAAEIVARHGETGRNALANALDHEEANDWGLIVMRCDLIRDAILAAIPKGGDA